jgi:hypothetical protein
MNSITPTPPTPTPPPKRTRYASPTPTPKKEMGLGQRMELVIFGLIFAGIPLYFILPIASKPIWTFFQIARWETTPCVVTQSRPVENKNDTQFSVEFTYEYFIGGQKFAAQDVGIETKKISGTLAETKLWSDQHPVGKETTCVVNPAAPQEALLERKFPWAALGGCAFIMLFVAIGISLMLWSTGVFSRKKKHAKTQENPVNDNPFTADINFRQTEPVKNSHRKEEIPRWIRLVFGFGFGSMGILVLYIVFSTIFEVRKSQNWVETPCIILQSEVTSRSESQSTIYALYARYSYEWKGEKFISEKYDFSLGGDSEKKEKYAALNLYPKGKKAICYVNPAAPSEAVLVRSAGDGFWVPLVIGALFSVVGIGIFFASLFSEKEKVLDAVPVRMITASTPVALRATKTPLRTFLHCLFITVLWNSIVGFFVSILIRDYLRDGKIDWVLGGIMMIFSFGSIRTFVAMVRAALSALGPKFCVTMKPVIRLGETVPLGWQIFGNPGDIHLLKLSLVCVEKITVGSGKNKQRQEHPRDTLELQELRGPLSANTGGLNVPVPLDALPSSVGDAEIVWKVNAELRHRFWPTQTWEFSVEVMC